MKVFGFIAAVLLLSGCGQKVEEPVKPMAKIKGKPIAQAPEPAKTNEAPPVAISEVVTNGPVKTVVTDTNAAPEIVDGFLKVGFEKLASFEYVMPDDVPAGKEAPTNQIPTQIKDLNEKAIALRGFMLPLKVEKGLVTEMLLMRDQSMCCFGAAPKINEWVSVKMTEKGVKPVMDQPVTLFGKLLVGEMKENGYLVGIYQLDGEKMDEN